MPRFQSMDALRGLIMLLMALDHASYFIAQVHPSEFWSAPLPHYTSALAFLTRFLSHLCAPGFFFLTGAGMVLFAQSRRRMGWSETAIRKHYLVRGLLLVLLQVLVENRAWALGSRGGGGSALVYLGVLYGLGASMATGAFMLRFPAGMLFALGMAALTATQWVVPGLVTAGESFSVTTRLLVVPGRTSPIVVLYPLVPWAGLTLLGMAYARWVTPRADAVRITGIAGAICLLLFATLRFAGGFGNTHPVIAGGWIDFLNVTKYPPSLTFVLLTLGLDLLLLALFSRAGHAWLRPLTVFGQTALFFYVAHLYLYAATGRLLAAGGTSLPGMVPFWIAGLVLLYPLCERYGRFKRAKAPDSLWRLF